MLASYKIVRLPVCDNSRTWDRIIDKHFVENSPVKTASLTAAIEPFVHYPDRMIIKTPESGAVITYTIIVKVTLKLLFDLYKKEARALFTALGFNPV